MLEKVKDFILSEQGGPVGFFIVIVISALIAGAIYSGLKTSGSTLGGGVDDAGDRAKGALDGIN